MKLINNALVYIFTTVTNSSEHVLAVEIFTRSIYFFLLKQYTNPNVRRPVMRLPDLEI